MAINSINSAIGPKSQSINESKNNIAPQTSNQTNQVATGGTGDTVTLTGTASQLRTLEHQIASLPVVDMQRVESIKQQITSGSYQIDPLQIADKMIKIESAINKGLT